MNGKDKLNLQSATLLNEGISNTSYLVNDEFVIRIKGQSFDLFNHIENEANIINKLKGKSFVEKVISYNEENGTKISKYIPDTKRLSNPPSEKELEQVANLLLELHRTNINANEFKAFERLNYYKKNVISEINPQHENNVVQEAKKLYEKYPLTFCHNDLVRGNLLFKGENIYLLDYEFAGMNIFLFDIASFLTENNIRHPSLISFFAEQYGNIDNSELNIMMKFLDILWYYWAKKLYQLTKKQIFYDIAKDKLSHIN